MVANRSNINIISAYQLQHTQEQLLTEPLPAHDKSGPEYTHLELPVTPREKLTVAQLVKKLTAF
jgi:hypothetical protein